MLRRFFRYCEKTAVVVDWQGEGYADIGRLLDCVSLEGVQRLFLWGELPPREFMEQSRLWECARYNHRYRSGEYVFKSGAAEVAKIEVRHISSWFPGASVETSAQNCQAGYEKLQEAVKSAFDLPLLGSPSMTGMAALERSLPIGIGAGAISLEAEAIIRNSTPQARAECWGKEWIERNGQSETDEFHYLDGRWFYAACCSFEMPAAELVQESQKSGEYLTLSKFPKGRRGWYKVLWSAPKDWAHVGLLPCFDRTERKWQWPLIVNEPVWVCEPELRLALEKGWSVTEVQRLTAQQARPLLTWSEKLKGLRTQAGVWGASAAPFVAEGVRKMLLDSIGLFYSQKLLRESWCPVQMWQQTAKALTDEQIFSAEWRDDKVYFTKTVRREDGSQAYYKPDWAAYVWSYCRRLLNKQLLEIPRKLLLGCNLDAIYTSRLPALPEDDGKPGRFRLKGQLHKVQGIDIPLTMAELTSLKRESEATYAALR